MNKNLTIIGFLIALIVVGGIAYYSGKNTSAPATDTSSTPAAPTPKSPATNTPPTPVSNVPGVPAVVTGTTVFPTDTTVILTGNITPKGAFTFYWYEYGNSSNLGLKTVNQTVGSGFTSVQAPSYITGLTKDSVYYYRLVAENQYGRTQGVTYSFQTTHGNPPPVGSAPLARTSSASGISRNTANLNGSIDPNRAETMYWFEYGSTTDLGNTTSLVSAGSGDSASGVSASISGLAPLTTYYFRLNAQNQFGTVNGSILNFKTAGPANPAAPSVSTRSVTSISSSDARLNGTVDPNRAETTFWFEYGTDSLLGGVLVSTTDHKVIGSGDSSVSVSENISGLDSNTRYYARVVAQNSMGVTRGDIVTFTTRR